MATISRRMPAPGAVTRRPRVTATTSMPTSDALKSQQEALASKQAAGAGATTVQTQKQALAAQPTLQKAQTQAQVRYDSVQAQRAAGGMVSPGAVADADAAALCTVDLRNRLLKAVEFAHGMWRLQAHFRNLVVNGPTAIGPPGCLAGPALAPMIRSAPEVVAATGLEEEIVDAVADGVSAAFAAWQSGVTVPGLPWYPAFAAWPGPMAPPTPNVPQPLIVCVSGMSSRLVSPLDLRRELKDALPAAARVPATEALMDNLASCLSLGFSAWLPGQSVSMVMGYGPVPSFAPPMSPLGPVVGGTNIPAPGHLLAGAGLNAPRMPYFP